jgi:hypothetical protein
MMTITAMIMVMTITNTTINNTTINNTTINNSITNNANTSTATAANAARLSPQAMRRCSPAHHGDYRAALVVGSRKSRYKQDHFISTADAKHGRRFLEALVHTCTHLAGRITAQED